MASARRNPSARIAGTGFPRQELREQTGGGDRVRNPPAAGLPVFRTRLRVPGVGWGAGKGRGLPRRAENCGASARGPRIRLPDAGAFGGL